MGLRNLSIIQYEAKRSNPTIHKHLLVVKASFLHKTDQHNLCTYTKLVENVEKFYPVLSAIMAKMA